MIEQQLIEQSYGWNYLDRNSITQARLYGLQEDTHVEGAVYDGHFHLLGRLYCHAAALIYLDDQNPAFDLSGKFTTIRRSILTLVEYHLD